MQDASPSGIRTEFAASRSAALPESRNTVLDTSTAAGLVSIILHALPNLVSVIGGEFLIRVASFLVVLQIAHSYGASSLGLFAATLAYSTFAVTVGEAGLQTGAIERISRNPAERDSIFSQLYAAKTLLFTCIALPALIIAIWLGASREIWIVAALVSLRSVAQSYSQLQLAILKSINRMVSIGIIQSAHALFLAAGVTAGFVYHWNFHALLWWMVCAQMLELLLSAGWLRSWGIRVRRVPITDCWHALRAASPVGLNNILAALIVRGDVIVLSLLASTAEVGQFTAANVILVVVYVIAWLFGSVLLPELVRLSRDEQNLDRFVRQWTRLIILIALPGALLLSCVAPFAMHVLYGDEFAPSGTFASIMILAIPLILLNSLNINRAIAARSPSLYLGTYAATAAVAILLNFALGSLYKGLGIAIAVVIREMAMLIIFHFRTGRLPLAATGK